MLSTRNSVWGLLRTVDLQQLERGTEELQRSALSKNYSQRRAIQTKKGVQPKENTTSWLYRLKSLLPIGSLDLPRAAPKVRHGRDLREIDNGEFIDMNMHKSLRTFSRYHRVVPDVLASPFLPSVNLVVAFVLFLYFK